MKDTRVLYFSAFRHVVPEDYERWFEELAAAGWHPVRVGQWSSIAMRFEQSEPRKYRYVIDMQAAPKRDYRPTYESFGWEFVGQMASAQVWRMAYADERPESFSDAPSREARTRRFAGAAAVSFTLFLLAAIAFAAGAIFSNLSASDRLQFGIAAALFLLLAMLLGLVMIKVRRGRDR